MKVLLTNIVLDLISYSIYNLLYYLLFFLDIIYIRSINLGMSLYGISVIYISIMLLVSILFHKFSFKYKFLTKFSLLFLSVGLYTLWAWGFTLSINYLLLMIGLVLQYPLKNFKIINNQLDKLT